MVSHFEMKGPLRYSQKQKKTETTPVDVTYMLDKFGTLGIDLTH